MTIEQMREFVILAEERNYQVAADMLYSTQGTLSRHIMAMEKELGFPLFNRSTKKIELTQDGSRFLYFARKAMKLQDDYMAELECAKRSLSDSLNVGYNALVSFYGFTEMLTQFMTSHPKVPIKIVEDDTDLLIKSVQNGSCDLAFIQEDPFHPIAGLDRLPIDSDTLCAILPAHHPLSKETHITLTQLADENFVFGIIDKDPARIFVEACHQAGFSPRITNSGLVSPALVKWIGSSNCVGLEWRAPADRHQGSQTVVVDIQPTVKSYTSIIYQAKHLSPAGRQLISYFEKYRPLRKE